MSSILISMIEGISHTVIWCLVLITSGIKGMGSALLWVAQGKYQTLCIKGSPEHAGFYASLFWGIALGSQILAYLVDSLILGYSTSTVLFIFAMCVSFSALITFNFLPDLDERTVVDG